ncbi:MAG: hypothetical protein WBQ43_03335 [Terriglobales bacterium]
MFSKLMDAMFGCRHARYSFPITVRPGSNRYSKGQHPGTYVACLDCGKEFRYDWQEMKVVTSQARAAAPSLVTKEAA